MRPEPADGLVGYPAECHFLQVLHKEAGNQRWQQ